MITLTLTNVVSVGHKCGEWYSHPAHRHSLYFPTHILSVVVENELGMTETLRKLLAKGKEEGEGGVNVVINT